jgi:hypothetical protein
MHSISLIFLRFCRLGGWRLDVRTLRSFVARCPEDKETANTFSIVDFYLKVSCGEVADRKIAMEKENSGLTGGTPCGVKNPSL